MNNNLIEVFEKKINDLDKRSKLRLTEAEKIDSRSKDLDRAIQLKCEIRNAKWIIGGTIVAVIGCLPLLSFGGCLNLGSILALTLGSSILIGGELYNIHCHKDRLRRKYSDVIKMKISEIEVYQEDLRKRAISSRGASEKIFAEQSRYQRQLNALKIKSYDNEINSLEAYLNQTVDYSNIHFNNSVCSNDYSGSVKKLIKK